MSGFVYKVRYEGKRLIKKEIPGQDTVDEFLYEVNALHNLLYSNYTIHFHGLVVDDSEKYVKGLLIAYAEQGALVDIIYDECKDAKRSIPWTRREKWARQIIHGLADIHDSGFVQGDFTVSNVVIDHEDDAKIIDVNRRGCPIGWEPPEATALVESNQRLSLYIGVKSDLYQLGMVLWAVAMEEDEPEIQGRPLVLGPEVNVPDWYRQITEICLNYDPRSRLGASSLIEMIPQLEVATGGHRPSQNAKGKRPDRTNGIAKPAPRPLTYDANYTTRGRSPPSPMPSNASTSRRMSRKWAASQSIAASYNDADDTETGNSCTTQQRNLIPTPENGQPVEQPRMESSGNMPALPRPSSANKTFDHRNPIAINVSHVATHEPQEQTTDSAAVVIHRTKGDETVYVSSYKFGADFGRSSDIANPKTDATLCYSSRPSSPDGEFDGGAELSRSEAEFSAADRSFDGGEYMRCSGQDSAKRSADGGHARNEALASALAGIGAAHLAMRDGVVNG
jgi:serine/threonine protein kinase